MLKAAFVLASCFGCTLATAALGAQELIVGSVRDADGRPVADAFVRATDAGGAPKGNDRTDRSGTFAIHPVAGASVLEVRCRHCRPQRVPAAAGANVVVIVTRYAALESAGVDANDFAVLPYGRAADVLGLVPFVLPAPDGTAVSDRGLGGGRGLVSDDGAALTDLATGSSALIDFPNRAVRGLALTRAGDAFRYGPYAGGGVFALDTLATAADAQLDLGPASALTLAPSLGTWHPAFAVSSDAGILARRADVDVTTPFAGGALRTGVTNASERIDTNVGSLARQLESARFAYATESRRYRTFIDLAASRVDVAAAARNDYAAAYGDGGFRVERPATVTLGAGVRATQQSASYDRYGPYSTTLEGRARSLTTFFEAHAGDARTRVDAGLSSLGIFIRTTLGEGPAGAAVRALLPALNVRSDVAGGVFARAGFSESLRLPTLVDSAAQGLGTLPAPFERAQLLEGALGFDAGGRVKGEAIAYRELAHGYTGRRLNGVGASVVWQVAPLIGLRFWSLRASPLDVLTLPYEQMPAQSRQVLWATFERRERVRIDLIARRDIASDTRAAVAFDGDVLVAAGPRLALNASTASRKGVRRFAIGLRAR